METDKNVFTIKDEELGLKADLYGHEARTSSHSHDFIEITFVEQGVTMHRVEGGKTSLLLPGDLLFIVPGTAHEYWKSTNNKVFNCLFYPKVLEQDLDALLQLPLLNQILRSDPEIKWGKTHLTPEYRHTSIETLRKIKTEGEVRKTGWKIRSKALLTDLLVIVARAWEEEDESKINLAEAIPYTRDAMMQILENSASSRMTVEEMAAGMGYSPEHFSRMVKRLTGITPSAYITSMRIAAAAQRLMDQRLSISEVAQLTGFDDVNYFSRVFKKETGKTPSEFRNCKL